MEGEYRRLTSRRRTVRPSSDSTDAVRSADQEGHRDTARARRSHARTVPAHPPRGALPDQPATTAIANDPMGDLLLTLQGETSRRIIARGRETPTARVDADAPIKRTLHNGPILEPGATRPTKSPAVSDTRLTRPRDASAHEVPTRLRPCVSELEVRQSWPRGVTTDADGTRRSRQTRWKVLAKLVGINPHR